MASYTDLQTEIDAVIAGTKSAVATDTYDLDATTAVEIDGNVDLDLGNSTIKPVNSTSFTTGGLKITSSSPLDRVIIRNGQFLTTPATPGDVNPPGPVIYTDVGLEIDLLQIKDCVFRDITYGCQIDVTGDPLADPEIPPGYVRNLVFSNNLCDGLVKKTSSPISAGLHVLFPATDPNGCSAISCGNVFRGLANYGIKVENGGPFLSLGDSFFNQDAGSAIESGAVFLSGGPHMRVSSGYFQNCKSGIKVYPVQGADCDDVSITDCTFYNSPQYGFDIYLNRYLVSTGTDYGIFKNVTVSNTRHYASDNTVEPIRVWAFDNMLLRGIVVARTTTDEPYGCIELYATGTSSHQSDNLTIDGVRFRYPNIPFSTTIRGFRINASMHTDNQPNVILKNIDFRGEGYDQDESLDPFSSAPTPYANSPYNNPNFKIADGTYWEL